jgi:hypothetical protein
VRDDRGEAIRERLVEDAFGAVAGSVVVKRVGADRVLPRASPLELFTFRLFVGHGTMIAPA